MCWPRTRWLFGGHIRVDADEWLDQLLIRRGHYLRYGSKLYE